MPKVLDSSALLAFIRGEPGGERVLACLRETALISTVSLSEVVAVLVRDGLSEDAALGLVASLPVEPVVFDRSLAYRAGLMISETQRHGLSFGDRACIATGLQAGVPVVTADHTWNNIASALGIIVDIIRPKSPRSVQN